MAKSKKDGTGFHNSWKDTSIVSPVSAEPGKADPGPPVALPPVKKPSDPLGFLDMPRSEK